MPANPPFFEEPNFPQKGLWIFVQYAD